MPAGFASDQVGFLIVVAQNVEIFGFRIHQWIQRVWFWRQMFFRISGFARLRGLLCPFLPRCIFRCLASTLWNPIAHSALFRIRGRLGAHKTFRALNLLIQNNNISNSTQLLLMLRLSMAQSKTMAALRTLKSRSWSPDS